MKQEQIKNIDKNIEYIKTKTEELIISMLDTDFSNSDKDEFDMKLQATRTAMVYQRDREMMKRISQGQSIRVFNLISSNPEELKEYIELTIPNAIPKLEHKN